MLDKQLITCVLGTFLAPIKPFKPLVYLYSLVTLAIISKHLPKITKFIVSYSVLVFNLTKTRIILTNKFL